MFLSKKLLQSSTTEYYCSCSIKLHQLILTQTQIWFIKVYWLINELTDSTGVLLTISINCSWMAQRLSDSLYRQAIIKSMARTNIITDEPRKILRHQDAMIKYSNDHWIREIWRLINSLLALMASTANTCKDCFSNKSKFSEDMKGILNYVACLVNQWTIW